MTQDLRNQGADPPRPVDAERVEAASAAFYDSMIGPEREFFPHHTGWAGKNDAFKAKIRERMALALNAADTASTAHSPDKAVTREGVTEIATDALEILPLVAERLAEHEGDNDEVLDDLIDRLRSALAPKPTGTEAGRGVIPAGWKLVPVEPTEEMLAAAWKADAYSHAKTMAIFNAMIAATPTPPVSPTPDSTGPAGAGVEVARAAFDKWFAATGLWTSHRGLTACAWHEAWAAARTTLTPPAPIADPSPDSTGQVDAQTEAARKDRARFRIQALGAALSRRDWSAVERAYEAIRDVHDRPEIYDAPLVVSQGDAQTQEGGR